MVRVPFLAFAFVVLTVAQRLPARELVGQRPQHARPGARPAGRPRHPGTAVSAAEGLGRPLVFEPARSAKWFADNLEIGFSTYLSTYKTPNQLNDAGDFLPRGQKNNPLKQW